MAKEVDQSRLIVSLEGSRAYQGMVDATAYFRHVNRLIEVFAALERAYLNKPQKQTRYLIADQKRVNPTIAELMPTPTKASYSPVEAQTWSARQLQTIWRGGDPDERLTSVHLEAIAKLPPEEKDHIRLFKVNGFMEEVIFDQRFKDNAVKKAAERRVFEVEDYFEGDVLGEVVGRLMRLDALEGDQAVLVPDIGAKRVLCIYPESMRREIGKLYDRKVIARGIVRYESGDPFPQSVEIEAGGIERLFDDETHTESLLSLEGIFEGSYDNDRSRSVFG